jgi:hypothetical protein
MSRSERRFANPQPIIWHTYFRILRLHTRRVMPSWDFSPKQGYQIFRHAIYQNGEKFSKLPQRCQMTICKLYQMTVKFQMTIKYTNIFHSKALQNLLKLGFLV